MQSLSRYLKPDADFKVDIFWCGHFCMLIIWSMHFIYTTNTSDGVHFTYLHVNLFALMWNGDKCPLLQHKHRCQHPVAEIFSGHKWLYFLVWNILILSMLLDWFERLNAKSGYCMSLGDYWKREMVSKDLEFSS